MSPSEFAETVWDARPIKEQVVEAATAVLTGRVWCGFDGPTGISKDEALDYAVKLALWAMEQYDGTGDA